VPVSTARRVAALLLAAVAVGALVAGCGLPGDRVHVSAEFTDSVGLYPGNPVAVLGIPVGTVTALRPAGTKVVVDMELDPDVPVPADAGAVTLSPSLVTDRRVELTPAYTGGPRLADGDLIPLGRTRTPVEIDRVFAAADRLAGALNKVDGPGGRPALSEVLDTTAETFAGNGDKLRRALHGLAAAVGVGADQRDQLVALIRAVDHLTGAAAEQDGTIRSFSTNLTDATALLDRQGPDLVRSLDEITELLDRTDALVRDNREAGGATLDDLRVTAHTLAGRTRELSEALDTLPVLFQNLTNIVDPQRKALRGHINIDTAVINNQLLGDVCARALMPAICPGPGRDPAMAGLARTLLGGAG
jgi:phospholipid/cholesterol/gamma-HCH transport system substrate-binding protein